MTDKVAAYIGFAQRAGAVKYGEDMICENSGSVKAVLIDPAAPEKYTARLQKRMSGKCPTFVYDGLKDATRRDNCYAIGITNDSLAKAIIESLR